MPSNRRGHHPRRKHRSARAYVSWVTALLVLVAAVGCSGGPPPGPDLEASGKVVLPADSPLKLGDLTAAGPFGDSSLAPDGAFTVPMAFSGTGLVIVTDQAGNVVLMGFLDTTKDGGEVSAASTAAVLLYLAVGGPFLDADAATIVDLVLNDPELPGLAAAVSSALATQPLALAQGDKALVDEVIAARDAIVARNQSATGVASTQAGTSVSGPLAGAGAGPQAVTGSGSVVIVDAGVRGGFDMLVSDDGFGVVVQNTKRRPARLLLYQTGVKSQEGAVTQFLTGVPVGEPIVVPPTRSISLALGLEDLVTGGAPLAPIESEPAMLPLIDGTTRTYYTGVLLAPTLIPGNTPPIFTDSRFFPYRDQWDEIVDSLMFETWWTSLLFPLMSTMAFGVQAHVAYAEVAALTPAVRSSTLPVLARAGIDGPMNGNVAKNLIRIIEEASLSQSTDYFWQIIEQTGQALGMKPPPQSSLLKTRSYMSGLSKTLGALAIVDALLAGGDVVAMLADMATNGQAETYDPVRLQTHAEIRPREGQVQRLVAPSQTFNLVIDEPLDGGNYLYRWSTSGEYGFISDYVEEGTTLDSPSDEIFYLANDPAVITPDLFDEIKVEVYLDDGSNTIKPGAEPVSIATATVVGKEKRDLITGSWVLVEDSYPEGDHSRYCAAVYVTFERQQDAREYRVDAFNFYDPYYWKGHYGATVYEQGSFNPYVPPCDEHRTPILVGNEIYLFLTGGHGPNPPDAGLISGRFKGMIVEVRVTY